MIRPARAKPTFSLRCSIDVEPSWLRTTSSIAWRIIASSSSSSLPLMRVRRGRDEIGLVGGPSTPLT